MNDLDLMRLGDSIRTARMRAGYTQDQFARLCRTSASHMSHIENGTSQASLETVYRIAAALKLSVDALLADQYEEQITAMETLMIHYYRSLDRFQQEVTVRFLDEYLRCRREAAEDATVSVP